MSTTEIPAGLVKQLREETGAGMMDCKRALQETGGDVEAAKRLLRERGMAEAGKRAGRETTEGLVGYTHRRRTAARSSPSAARPSRSRRTTSSSPSPRRCSRPCTGTGPRPRRSSRTSASSSSASSARTSSSSARSASRSKASEVVNAYVHPPANKIGVLVKREGGERPSSRASSRCTSRSPRREYYRARRGSGGGARGRADDLREAGRGAVEAGAGA